MLALFWFVYFRTKNTLPTMTHAMVYVKNETTYHTIYVQLKTPTLQAFTIGFFEKKSAYNNR